MSETQAIPSSLPLDHSLIPAYAMTSSYTFGEPLRPWSRLLDFLWIVLQLEEPSVNPPSALGSLISWRDHLAQQSPRYPNEFSELLYHYS